MEKNRVSAKIFRGRWVAGGAVILTILANSFSFVVQEGEVAVVTRFGAPKGGIYSSGMHSKFPWPFEKVYVLDKRKHYYDTTFVETLTNDKKNVIIQTYAVWNIIDPLKFLQSTGSKEAAEANIDSLVSGAKNGILGKYNLSALVSTKSDELKLNEIEEGILSQVADPAFKRYGILISQIGLKKIGLPEENTNRVFEQMRAERLKFVEQLKAEGERDAAIIRNTADIKVAELKAEGTREAAKINGQSELEAARIYANAQRQDPYFYSFLRRLDSTEKILGDKTTLIFRNDSAPFNVLSEGK
jgi:membrane protease subunit HflC